MSDSCCPSGSWPALVEDSKRELLGAERKLESGLNIYECKNDSKQGIVVIYDVHGFSGGRIKGVVDQFGKAGFYAVMPDVYGDSAGVNDFGGFGSPGGKAFLEGHDWKSLAPKLDEVYAEMKANGVESIGIIGFCWGAWVVFHASSTGKVNAGVSCHPSVRVGPLLYGEQETALAQAVTVPQCLMPASNDPANLKTGGELVNIINGNDVLCETHEYADMMHGWVPRGDASQPLVAEKVEHALTRATLFFRAHL